MAWNSFKNRRDVKQLTRDRFARLDGDIVSAYVDDAEEERLRSNPNTVTRVVTTFAGQVMVNGRALPSRGTRKDVQTLRSAGGLTRNTEMVYRVRIPHGRKYTVPWIIKNLHQQIKNIRPLLVAATSRGDVEFFLKSQDAADACKALSGRIDHRVSGDRMTFTVDRVVAPWTRLNREETAIIEERGLRMVLNMNNVMLTVVESIDEKFGSITALSLQSNRLRHLDFAAILVSVTKFLKVLDLSHNQIDKISELEKLKGLPVETLFFEGNPLAEQLTTVSGYLSAVHHVFPEVRVLVSCHFLVAIQPASSAYVPPLVYEQLTSEPPCRPGYYGNDNLRVLIERFLVDYFKLYDGEDGAITRRNLLQAYDEDNSTFTLTIANLRELTHDEFIRYPNDACYDLYIRSSHNVLSENRWSRNRSSRTYRGAINITVLLSKLPITKHYTESFIVDMHLISKELIAFSVQGLFEDGIFAKSGVEPQLNYFTRSFIASPQENGSIAILSVPQLLPSPSTVNSVTNTAKPNEEVQMSSQLTVEIKRKMVKQFCKDSGMVAAWSERCLSDCHWDYEAAGRAFLSVRDKIPREAFGSL
ncbi:hypothetical protein KIN20_018299 [Parelaphostrongylus tenuis]|uniref:Nuclear RNA export factor 1 n=1 Tax=Parelaphostrongylus tenuis TaxID=148309 RepID=A0AAD5MPM2_PARTN|nr:hypothetical protein KIN20_018299 [Parelaphostrongylus tenuis]